MLSIILAVVFAALMFLRVPIAIVTGALASITAVPMALVAMYLRSLRDQQTQRNGETTRRVKVVEDELRAVRRSIGRFEQDFTRKEEWLREYMIYAGRADMYSDWLQYQSDCKRNRENAERIRLRNKAERWALFLTALLWGTGILVILPLALYIGFKIFGVI